MIRNRSATYEMHLSTPLKQCCRLLLWLTWQRPCLPGRRSLPHERLHQRREWPCLTPAMAPMAFHSKCTAINQLKGSSVPGYSLDLLMNVWTQRSRRLCFNSHSHAKVIPGRQGRNFLNPHVLQRASVMVSMGWKQYATVSVGVHCA